MTKKIYLMLLSVFLSVTYLSAQVVQTVNVPTAGGLATAIGSNLKTVTDLTLTGTMNAADFNTIKQMTALKNLDMSKVSVVDNAIPDYAFASSTIKTLILPSSVKVIGNYCFLYSSTAVDFNNTKSSLTTLGSAAFLGCTGSKVLDFSDFNLLKNFEVNSLVGVFSNYSGHVVLPSYLETVPDYLFKDFKGSVSLSENIKSIGTRSFASAQMSSLVLPSSLTNIGDLAFQNAKISSGLSLPSSVKVIGDYCFNNSSTVVDFRNTKSSLTTLGSAVFSGYTGSTVLDFSDFNSLKNFEVNSLEGVFSYYSGHVVLPSYLETVPGYLFIYFKGSVSLSENIKSIGTRSFASAQMSSLVLPSSLTSIGEAAFQSSSITLIDIPAGVTSIGGYAFHNATKLSKIISNNPTPPTLGANVFLGVNKETTTLEVPKESLTLYGSAAQWKDFLNIKVTIPKELDVKYSYNGVDFWDYHAIRIGEYYWFDENFYHYALKEQWSGERGDEINYPMTQARLNKYMPFVYLDSLDYQVNIDDFNRSYGLHHHWYSARDLEAYGSIYNSGKKEKGWGLPTAGDAEQLFAMAPSFQEPYVNYQTVTYGLGAHLGDNPMAFDIAPKTPGSPYKTDWFTLATRYTSPEEDLGFKLMPNGAKLNSDNDTWRNGLLDPFTGDSSHIGNKGDIYHLFYASGFWLKNQGYAYIHDHLTIVTIPESTFHWMGIRYTRRLTDEELGYKLYKNDSKEDIVKLGLTETPPVGYTELEPGYLRGYYVKYIINKPTSGMTPKDLYYKLKHYTNVELPQPKTRSFVSDQAVVPFKTDASITLYPNPIQNVLNISGDGVEKVTIYDMSGRQVSTAKNVNTILVSDLSKGTYLVRVLTVNGESTHKVIKK